MLDGQTESPVRERPGQVLAAVVAAGQLPGKVAPSLSTSQDFVVSQSSLPKLRLSENMDIFDSPSSRRG